MSITKSIIFHIIVIDNVLKPADMQSCLTLLLGMKNLPAYKITRHKKLTYYNFMEILAVPASVVLQFKFFSLRNIKNK